ncbi:MAG: S1 family peptidase [Methanobacterium sp.]
MRSSIKALTLIIAILAVLAVSGEFVAINVLETPSIDPNSSVVYVQNGVSGVVTIKDPALNKTVPINIDYYPLTSGSGEIVTKDGYIITAFHVISDPKTLENQQQLKIMDDNDIKMYLEQFAVTEYLSRYNPQLGRELLNQSTNNRVRNSDVTSLLIQNNLISVNSSKQLIKVKTYSSLNYLDAQLVDVGNPMSDDDVAILKVNAKNLPALNISSNNPSLGENIRIYGYPGNQNSIQLESSSGSVIGKVPNTQGVVYYETNAPTINGYSGGPTLDNKNRILGILIYGVQSRGHFRSQTTSTNSLFLSSDYLIQLCKKNNVPINIS